MVISIGFAGSSAPFEHPGESRPTVGQAWMVGRSDSRGEHGCAALCRRRARDGTGGNHPCGSRGEGRDRISAGRVAKTVVSSFIPFRGLIREVSGANDHDRKVRAAIQAGIARRGFLKGVGQSKGCAWPARPATRQVVAAYMGERVKPEPSPTGEAAPASVAEARYVSQPVVQRTD